MFVLGLYMYGTLWAYTLVFSKAMSEAIPLARWLGLGEDSFLLFVAIFSLIVVPLTCMELKEQISVQVRQRLHRLMRWRNARRTIQHTLRQKA